MLVGEFNSNELLRFGNLVEDGKRVYATIIGRVHVNDVARRQTAHSTLARDIKSVLSKKKYDSTTQQSLIDARLGQGAFRRSVLHAWQSRCAVTGCGVLDVIRASHIKPWRNATDDERLDPMNGLPLVATLDALFDAGLISFEDSGRMLVSSQLSRKDQQSLGVIEKRLKRKPPADMSKYLSYHRRSVYRHPTK